MTNNYIEIIGLIAAAVSTINQLPQAWKIIRSNDTKSISATTYFLLWISVMLWLSYGWLDHDRPLIISNLICIVPITYILVIKIIHIYRAK